jgi:hypothetical protein
MRCYCNICRLTTPHAEIAAHTSRYADPRGKLEGKVDEEWALFQCTVCGKMKVVVTTTSENGSEDIHYPALPYRQPPDFALLLPAHIQLIIKEIYSALDGNCPCLAAMGTRTIVDGMLNGWVGDIGGFEQKLNAAVDKQLLTPPQRKAIDAVVEVGHAVSHRNFIPTLA